MWGFDRIERLREINVDNEFVLELLDALQKAEARAIQAEQERDELLGELKYVTGFIGVNLTPGEKEAVKNHIRSNLLNWLNM